MKKLSAKEIAQRPYAIELFEDKTTIGEKIYLAKHPELEGCMAQGETKESAIRELEAATIDYIESLIEDKQPIPEPLTTTENTSGGKVIPLDKEIVVSEPIIEDTSEYLQDLKKVMHSGNRKIIATLMPEEINQAA